MRLRRLWTVLVGVWAGAVLGRLVFDWVLGLETPWIAAGVLAGAVAGGVAGIAEAWRLRPMSDAERRDAILGWGGLIGGTAAVACLLLPLPWSVLAALGVLAVTVLALGRATRPQA